MKTYDLAFSLGGACSCTQSLRAAGLQFASFPFDWLTHADLPARTEQFRTDFASWLDARALEEVFDLPTFPGAVLRDTKTGLLFGHDFDKETPWREQLPEVCARYARRKARLFDLIGRSRRVLAVWIDVPACRTASCEELADCRRALQERWPGVVFDILALRYCPEISFRNRLTEESEGVRMVTYDYRNHDPKETGWVVDFKSVGKWMRNEYAVVDYRTDEDRRRWTLQRREEKLRRFHAKGFWECHLNRLKYKLYRHLQKDLARRGVIRM